LPARATRALPLAGLVFLGNAVSADSVTVELLSVRQTALHLVANSTATMFLDRQARAAEFPHVTAIARSVPGIAIGRHEAPQRLNEVVDTIEAWAISVSTRCA
jgi:hypothetical protein